MFYRYDVDTYVRNVEGNFVLWEIKGRTDDGYTSSTKKVSQLLRMQFKYSFVHNGLHAKYDCSYTC